MIPVNEPLLGETDLQYVTECVRTGWISSAGRFIDEFEQRWAAYCGKRYGIAVSNGTTALQLAVAALDLQPGDEIIMPSFTIISCALAAVYNGAVPVLIDSDPATWCMDVTQIEKKISERTRSASVASSISSWRCGVTACATPFTVLAVWCAWVRAAEAALDAADAARRPTVGVRSRAAAAPVAAPSAKEKTVRIPTRLPETGRQ